MPEGSIPGPKAIAAKTRVRPKDKSPQFVFGLEVLPAGFEMSHGAWERFDLISTMNQMSTPAT